MCCGACFAVGLTGASCALVFVCSHDAIGGGTVVVRAAGILCSVIMGVTVIVRVGCRVISLNQGLQDGYELLLICGAVIALLDL